MKLVLFDIDGTLLTSNGQSARHLFSALKEHCDTLKVPDDYNFAGKTDPLICRDLLTASGLDHDEVDGLLLEIQRTYFDRFFNGGLDQEQVQLLPSAAELVERIAGLAGVDVGLVTGNWEQSGRAKLDAVGINHHFDFGGFGEDGPDRRRLPAAARERATAWTGRTYRAEEVLIIGDTILDVDCAHANGMKVLAVTTGTTDRDTLQSAGADRVVDSLEDVIEQDIKNILD